MTPKISFPRHGWNGNRDGRRVKLPFNDFDELGDGAVPSYGEMNLQLFVELRRKIQGP